MQRDVRGYTQFFDGECSVTAQSGTIFICSDLISRLKALLRVVFVRITAEFSGRIETYEEPMPSLWA
jgi:hypothetical protein